MTPEHLSSRRSRARVALVAMAVGGAMALGACAPTPAPDPTSTPLFASEEEAFAAAEATYRAYSDAAALVDYAVPDSFSKPLSFSVGTYNQEERKFLLEMNAEGYKRSGRSSLLWVSGINFDSKQQLVTLRVCEDVTATTFTDRDGNSLVPAERADVVALDVHMTEVDGILRIYESESVRDPKCF